MEREVSNRLCMKVLIYSSIRIGFTPIQFCVFIGLVHFFVFGHQCSFSQTTNFHSPQTGSPKNPLGEDVGEKAIGPGQMIRRQANDFWAQSVDPMELSFRKAQTPYENLIILVGDQWALNVQCTRLGKKLGGETTAYLTYDLFADGTFGVSTTLMEPRVVAPEVLLRNIKVCCMMQDNFILNFKTWDDDVDYHSVFKAIQKLKGVEKKFKNFKIILDFSDAPSAALGSRLP